MGDGRRRRGFKGLRLKFRRVFLLPRRYGLSSKKFLANLDGMVGLLRSHGVAGTFPVTAMVLRRHPELSKVLQGMEVAVHGFRHSDMSVREAGEQESSVRRAVEIARSHGFEPVGFRAPYLRKNEATLDAVEGAGLLYDSSTPVAWWCGRGLEHSVELRRALASYGVEQSSGLPPIRRGRLILLPVALPDDEILIDRLGITSDEKLSEALLGMIDSAFDSRGHLVLQLHPERFRIFEDALDKVLKRSKEKGAWIATLKEVAVWRLERSGRPSGWPGDAPCALTVSGDIDAVTLGDFGLRIVGR